MGIIVTPKAELEITDKLVRQLLQDQFPDLSHLPIDKIDEGWDNISYKLGEKYVVRIPRRKVADKLIKSILTYIFRKSQSQKFSVLWATNNFCTYVAVVC